MRVVAFFGACAIAALIALPAFPDIKSFNAAVSAGDFKQAAAEAATTWPALDKSREDIATIAREFGFVSYVAKDYAAAKTFAEFAAAQSMEDDGAAETRTVSNVLLRAAEYRLKPSDAARDALFGALETRASLPGFDNISFAATEAVVGHDLEKGRWRNAVASSALAANLAGAGGPYYTYEHRKYELYGVVADYRVNEKAEAHEKMSRLLEAVWLDTASTQNDRAAQRFVELYWEVSAWRTTLSAHLKSRRVREFTNNREKKEAEEKERWSRLLTDERVMRLMGRASGEPGGEICQKTFDVREKPKYPNSALFRGFVGSVVLRADIDDSGRLHNPEILAAVPEKYFGGAVLEKVDEMRYLPGKAWDPAVCRMAQDDRVIIFEFSIYG